MRIIFPLASSGAGPRGGVAPGHRAGPGPASWPYLDRPAPSLGLRLVSKHRQLRLRLPSGRQIQRGFLSALSPADPGGGISGVGHDFGRLRHLARGAAGRVPVVVETGGTGNAFGARGGTHGVVPALLPRNDLVRPDLYGIAFPADHAGLFAPRAAGAMDRRRGMGNGLRLDADPRSAAGRFSLSRRRAAMVGTATHARRRCARQRSAAGRRRNPHHRDAGSSADPGAGAESGHARLALARGRRGRGTHRWGTLPTWPFFKSVSATGERSKRP